MTQLSWHMGQPGAGAQVTGTDAVCRGHERIHPAQEKHVPAHPGRGKCQNGHQPQEREVASQQPVGRGKGHLQRDADIHGRDRALHHAGYGEGGESVEAVDAIFPDVFGHPLA